MHEDRHNRSRPALEPEQDQVLARTRQDGSEKGAPLVLALKEVVKSHRPLVGGKAASLAVLIRAQLPVPPGFCVTAAAFGQWLSSCSKHDELSQILSQLSRARPAQIADLSEAASASLIDTPIPPRVEAAVLSAWREHGAERAYAVRSSATVEDAADHSFAGQFESFLNVRGKDALLAAVKKCWLSLYSERVLAYQANEGLSAGKAAMAVVVQEVVPVEVAGVLFTVDPVSGNSGRMVIEGVRGLGDTLVSGKVNPERVVLNKAKLRLLDHSAPNGPSCLEEPLARRLGKLARKVERLFGGPQDIEWALCGGAIYLLQARPVTGQRIVKTRAKRQIWTNANSGKPRRTRSRP